jgi:hypothetical protein
MFHAIDYNLYERVQYLESIINNDITTLQNRIHNLKLNDTKSKKINYNKRYYESVKTNEDIKVKYNSSAKKYYEKIREDPVKYQNYLEKKRNYRKLKSLQSI